MKRLEINHEYEARDPAREQREHQYWLDNLATRSGDLNAPIKPLDKPKGKTNETNNEMEEPTAT